MWTIPRIGYHHLSRETHAIATELDSLKIDRSDDHTDPSRRGLVVLLVVVLVAIAAGAWWFLRGDAAATVKTSPVTEVRGSSGGGTVLNASGYVTARRRATISSKVTGKVVEVLVEEGMAVRRGDVVARLDELEARVALRLSESRADAARKAVAETSALLEKAQLDLERAERLVREGVAEQANLDQARTDVAALKARLELRRQEVVVAERVVAVREVDLENLIVRAPFDGVVVSKDAQPGEMVSPISAGGGFTRTGLCTVVDMTSLEIEVDVNENYISRVSPGQSVEAILDAYPEWRIPAHVITTIPTADRQRATVLVRIAFEALDERILPDMGVKVAFMEAAAPVEDEPTTRLTIPRSALRRDGDREIVFVLIGDRVERRAIRTVAGDEERVQVVAGLSAGERVVTKGPEDLVDGAPAVEQ